MFIFLVHLSQNNLSEVIVDLLRKLSEGILFLFSIVFRLDFFLLFLWLLLTFSWRLLHSFSKLLCELEKKNLDILSWQSFTNGIKRKLHVGPLRCFEMIENHTSVAILFSDS